jgi:hypothetical protein
MTIKTVDPFMKEMNYVLDPATHSPELRTAYDVFYAHLLECAEEAKFTVGMLPVSILRDLGEKLLHDKTPLGTITTVLNRHNYHNILDPMETVGRSMIRELIKSDQLVDQTQRTLEFFRQEIANYAIHLCKEEGP